MHRNMKIWDVVAVGELLIDFVAQGHGPGAGEAVEALHYVGHPGGAPANVAVGVARLGRRAAFVGRVGDDAFGRFLASVLAANGVDGRALQRDAAAPTPLAFVSLDAQGQRSFSFYRQGTADLHLQASPEALEVARAARILHFGTVTLSHEPARSQTLRLVEAARAAGALISCDVNWRPALWPTAAEAPAVVANALGLADVVKVSDEEWSLVAGESWDDQVGPRRAAALMSERGWALLVVTLGQRGCYFRAASSPSPGQPTGEGWVPAYRVRAVDTTGAGDAFVAALLSRLCGRARQEVAALSGPELASYCRYAAAAAACSVQRYGAIPSLPTAAQVEALLSQGE